MAKLLMAVLLLFPALAIAQIPPPEDILARYEKYPMEKVFIHLDKGEYLAGEPLQFKAYVSCRGQLTKISTNLYIELLDQNRKVVSSCKAPVISGVSEGYMLIPATLPENVYYIRAYTSWMLNFDEAFQFVGPLNIYNNSSDKKLVKARANWKVHLKPEGGNWVANTMTKVAVRLQGVLPATVQGYLFEGKDTANKITGITFYNNEVGSLLFTPLPGKDYSVMIADNAGNSKLTLLPAASDKGVALKVTAASQYISYRLQAMGISEHLKGYKIVADNQGKLIYSVMIPGARASIESKIPLDDKIDGIVHITVFDASGKPAADRLCFVENSGISSSRPVIAGITRSEKAKDLNHFEISNVDTLYRHTYLVEVADCQTPMAWPGQDLPAAFYFSDIPQMPENAAWYVSPGNPKSGEALDYLLISEDRGVYDWHYLLEHPAPGFTHFPDNNITYKGKISLGKKPVANEAATVLLNFSDTVNIVRQVKTDNNGEFIINKIFFRDSAKAYFHIHKKTRFDELYEISFKEVWDTAVYSLPLPVAGYELASQRDEAVNERVQRYAQALSAFDLGGEQQAKALEEVKVQAVRNLTKELNKELSTPLFSDAGEVVMDFVNQDEGTGGTPLLEYLSGRLPGYTAGPGEAPQFRGGAITLYLDEMVADMDMINTIPVSNIAMVKLLRNAFVLGHSNGVLAVYTKRGKLYADAQPGKKPAKYTLLTGYPQADRFKQIDYSEPEYDKNIRDTRSILLWKPVFDTGGNRVKFYNNDTSKTLQLILTGLDAAGRPFYINKEF